MNAEEKAAVSALADTTDELAKLSRKLYDAVVENPPQAHRSRPSLTGLLREAVPRGVPIGVK